MSELIALLTKFVYEIFGVAVILLVAAVLSHAVKRLVNVLRDMKHVSPQIAQRLHAVRRWTVILLAVLAILEALGIFRGAWAFVSTALAALALGFVAAWSVLSNATAALLILTFRPFRIGDEVELLELTNGYPIGGHVLDMNLLYTTLRVEEPDGTETPEGSAPRLIHVPNNLFFQKPLRTRSHQPPGSKLPFFNRTKG